MKKKELSNPHARVSGDRGATYATSSVLKSSAIIGRSVLDRETTPAVWARWCLLITLMESYRMTDSRMDRGLLSITCLAA